ncbi:winged helix-turn-helix domain-containing protein [Fictibacillus sp. BK138]|uniref:winged helix-turn-helix domain-containing protein n=1 Tax=Fictibacillus sp. BK138 TaxID=2512121 RepID=UPI0010DA8A05|nr:helix-turn-helix domain-containing protein [Fictibacillus sp. BK138]RZT15538.1 DNA-binding IscR family transcriptional regulator [Fictibacillus sp. BK138]
MKWKMLSMELMKILSDPRRNKILHLASEEPVTVKKLAEEMNEEPVRLYYHIKMLVNADLLEVVETRQIGNLTEKYYKTINLSDVIYKGNIEEQAEHVDLALSLLHKRLDPGLHLYQKALEKIREEKKNGKTFKKLPFQVSIDTSSSKMTGQEWRESIEPIMKAMGKNKDIQDPWPEIPTDVRDDEEGTFQYVLISYRVEDAEQLGLIKSEED